MNWIAGMTTDNHAESQIVKTKKIAREIVKKTIGEKLFITITVLGVWAGWAGEVWTTTKNVGYELHELFSPRTSVLTSSELEIANEHVIVLDRRASFDEINVQRTALEIFCRMSYVIRQKWNGIVGRIL